MLLNYSTYTHTHTNSRRLHRDGHTTRHWRNTIGHWQRLGPLPALGRGLRGREHSQADGEDKASIHSESGPLEHRGDQHSARRRAASQGKSCNLNVRSLSPLLSLSPSLCLRVRKEKESRRRKLQSTYGSTAKPITQTNLALRRTHVAILD